MFLHRLARAYRATALLLLNTGLVLALLNGAASVVFRIKDRFWRADSIYDALDDGSLAKLYPGRSRRDIESLWRESVRELSYEPFTEFREPPRTGVWVNVDAAGFRHIENQAPWPPEPNRFNVFVFGGSTTFGYGVADGETLASRLQALLASRRGPVGVYNFGRGYYYSTQERILFEQLLATGYVPRMAIFVDGMNDFSFEKDDSAASPRLAAGLDGRPRSPLTDWLAGLSLGRAVDFVRRRVGQSRVEGASAGEELSDDAIRHVISRYLENKRLVEGASAAHGVTPVFVWQPVPTYKYDTRFHPFAAWGFAGVARTRRGYTAMADFLREHPVGGNFIWLADVQERSREPLYVDLIHYSPAFLADLADRLDTRIAALGLYDGVGPNPIDPAATERPSPPASVPSPLFR